MTSFRFCPNCGADGLLCHHRQLCCQQCGFIFFLNCAAAAGAFIQYGECIVLCIRGKEPGKGLLDLPGGFIEAGETLEDGLRREIREELNVEVCGLNYVASAPNDYFYAGIAYKTMDVFFTCVMADASALRAQDDVADFILIQPDSIDPAQFAFESVRRAFAVFMEQRAA